MCPSRSTGLMSATYGSAWPVARQHAHAPRLSRARRQASGRGRCFDGAHRTSLKFEGKFTVQTKSDARSTCLSPTSSRRTLCAVMRVQRGALNAAIADGKAAPESFWARHSGLHHRPGQLYAALSGHRSTGRPLAGRNRDGFISASRSRYRHLSGWVWPSFLIVTMTASRGSAGGPASVAQFLPEEPERMAPAGSSRRRWRWTVLLRIMWTIPGRKRRRWSRPSTSTR